MMDEPPAHVSTMDGYAVRECDLEDDRPLRLVGTSWPGAGFVGAVGAGQCVRIFTGAPLPEVADRVAIQAIVERADDKVRARRALGDGRPVRAGGSDFRTGHRLRATRLEERWCGKSAARS